MSSSEREFELGDILSITTERLVSTQGMEGIYEILSFMAGESLFTHQLLRAADEYTPVLLAQHPQLATVSVPDKFEGQEHVNRWLAEQQAVHGKMLAVRPLAAMENHTAT